MPDTNAGNAATKEIITKLRAQLHALVEQYGLDDSKVLEFSRELDLFILRITQND